MTRCFDCNERIEDADDIGLLTVSIGANTFQVPAHEDCVPEKVKE